MKRRTERHTKHQGVTIVEMAIGTAMLAIMVVLFSGFMKSTSKSTTRALQNEDLTHTKMQALTWFTRDFQSASAHTVGNNIFNGGFEEDTLNHWDANVTGMGSVTHEENNQVGIHSGLKSIFVQSSVAAPVNYFYADTIKLDTGKAYWITAWALTDNTNTEASLIFDDMDPHNGTIGTAMSTSDSWTEIGFRFPATGVYGDLNTPPVPNHEFRLWFMVDNGARRAYFDDAQILALNSILIAPNPNAVNVPTNVTNIAHLDDPVGFRFVRWDEDQKINIRYRSLINTNNKTTIVREVYNTSTSKWENKTPPKFTDFIQYFEIGFGYNGLPPSLNENTPVILKLAFSKDPIGSATTFEIDEELAIYPLNQ